IVSLLCFVPSFSTVVGTSSQQVYSSSDLRSNVITAARNKIYLSFSFTRFSVDLSA
ncbi:hypothetical protein S245_032469, partial [Arachis hypogaea]